MKIVSNCGNLRWRNSEKIQLCKCNWRNTYRHHESKVENN